MKSDTIILLSGGQDSTTCLYWALAKKHSGRVIALNIAYGQRHQIEIQCAKTIADIAGVELIAFDLGGLFTSIGDSALISTGDINAPHRDSNLPASFVPGRNIILLTVAAMIAYKRGIKNIVTGVCETDSSGYPDCRRETISTLQAALGLGMDYEFYIWTPLMHLNKAQTVDMARSLPGCMNALAYSHTCYEGAVPPCGECPACKLRARGFEQAGVPDPLIERLQLLKGLQ